MVIHRLVHARLLPTCRIVAVHHNVVLVQHDEIPAVPADFQIRTHMDIPVEGLGGALAVLNGVDDKLGAVVHVAAHENVRFGGLVGQRVCLGIVPPPEFHLGALQQFAPLDGLADGKDHQVCLHSRGLGFVIDRGEFSALRVDGPQALLEHHAGNAAGFVLQDLFWAPFAADGDVFFQGLPDFLPGGGHGFPALQADHTDLLRSEPGGSPGAVHRHVAAADDQHLA